MQGDDNNLDFLKVNLESFNKRKYLQKVKQTIKNEKSVNDQELKSTIEAYEDSYRSFLYHATLLADAKSATFIDECLNSVHPGLKSNKTCKNILSILSKVFVQELIEQSIQIFQERNAEDIDVDILEQAYRRKKNQKQNYHNLNAIIQ